MTQSASNVSRFCKRLTHNNAPHLHHQNTRIPSFPMSRDCEITNLFTFFNFTNHYIWGYKILGLPIFGVISQSLILGMRTREILPMPKLNKLPITLSMKLLVIRVLGEG